MKVEQLTCALGAHVTGGVAENSGHWIPEERPDVVAAEILRHFRTHA